MNHSVQQQGDLLRETLKEQLSTSDDRLPQLLACIDAWEREPELLIKQNELQADNDRLRVQLKKLREASTAKDNSYMSSRLRDALRE